MQYKGATVYTYEEVAEILGLGKRQIDGKFGHHRDKFHTPQHTIIINHEGCITRVFTKLGLERMRFVCKGLIKKSLVKKAAENAAKNKQLKETPENFFKHSDEPAQVKSNEDDAVLDIAVKIIAERQAFNKIKEEIVLLREENEKLKTAHTEMCQTLNLIASAMYGWRQ